MTMPPSGFSVIIWGPSGNGGVSAIAWPDASHVRRRYRSWPIPVKTCPSNPESCPVKLALVPGYAASRSPAGLTKWSIEFDTGMTLSTPSARVPLPSLTPAWQSPPACIVCRPPGGPTGGGRMALHSSETTAPVKAALTSASAESTIVQPLVPAQAPPQPEKVALPSGLADSATEVPWGKLAMQAPPQSMPAGEERTVPGPLLVMRRVRIGMPVPASAGPVPASAGPPLPFPASGFPAAPASVPASGDGGLLLPLPEEDWLPQRKQKVQTRRTSERCRLVRMADLPDKVRTAGQRRSSLGLASPSSQGERPPSDRALRLAMEVRVAEGFRGSTVGVAGGV